LDFHELLLPNLGFSVHSIGGGSNIVSCRAYKRCKFYAFASNITYNHKTRV